MSTMTKEAFEAACQKVIDSYKNDKRIQQAINAKWAVIRHEDDLWSAAGENASLECELNTTEFVEMFASSIEGILSN